MASQSIKITYTSRRSPHAPLIAGRVIRGGRSATRKG